jgi:hypothetical protein
MKRTILYLLLTAYLSGCRTYEPRLYGTWKSDANKSVARLEKCRNLSEKDKKSWLQIFGKMEMTFDKASITCRLPEEGVGIIPYRVLGKNSDTVVIQWIYDSLLEDKTISIIRLENDGLWISNGGYVWEFYKKNKTKPNQ